MPIQLRPCVSSVLTSVLAAGLMLTVASCSHITPIGPGATMPQPRHLRSPFVLEAMRVQPSSPAGGCPAASVALSGGPGQCYRELRHPGNNHFRSGLPTPSSASAGPEDTPVRIHHHRARCRSGGTDSGHHDRRQRPRLSQH